MKSQYPSSITKEAVNALPMLEYRGRIEVIETVPHALLAVKELATAPVLGFDTETRPSFQKGQSYKVAMLQLGTKDCAYLFRLSKIPLLPEVTALLENEAIVKVGVAIHDDLKGLQKILPFTPKGFVDLAKEAEKKGFPNLGLRTLTAIFLGLRLSKGAKVTNWERNILTPAQLQYAANDANVALKIYDKLLTL